jgi:hypothetical protein
MVKYLKNPNSLVKVDPEVKSLLFYILQENIIMIRKDDSEYGYNHVTVISYNNGRYLDATEEEFLAFKDLCLNKFN